MNGPLSPWDRPGVLERLIELWHRLEFTSEQIGELLAPLAGGALTKCSVIGKAYRMGLGKRGRPVGSRPSRPRAKVVRSARPPLLPMPAWLRPVTCCWPLGDAREPGFRFCAEAPVAGRSYCAAHHALAYRERRTGRTLVALT